MGKMDKRVDSYSKLYSEEANARNKSVAWMYEPTARVLYILGIGMTFMATWTITETTIPKALTMTSVIHFAATFSVLHWIKGSPDFYDQGTFNGLTAWEQLDGGEHFTFTKKYLMLVPTLLTLLTLYMNEYSTAALAINVPLWLVLMIGKSPMMHRVRLMGVNSTPGIDDSGHDMKKSS